MMAEKVSRKDKNQNIQVFVRLRPLNQREKDIKSLGVVEVVQNKEVVVRQSQQTSLTKKFTFDKAFGPNAKQVEVYQHVVSPLIEEVLAGYNCTVFAYGQTGTGKTHTMVGEHRMEKETDWQSDPDAGIIPRALSQLFDELRISNTEYTVRVSYLELYNEELFDLLSSSDDNSKLRIYEDVTRKGSNIVNGLEEITVYNKSDVYKIMAQGQDRKRVASTLMNAHSSRSHTVFTILVHMKENSPEGEELVKIGKLNLVDLAGSENISKAGSDNPAKKERARECVNINQSLLTLGRVITALVERHPHIPYRESKLTRILQESLGGRTKTSIIATVSPGHKDLEETMSTLEYAHRAKNIQNKPEINQKMTKKAILKEYSEEIDRLKKDLQAARDKNGVYLASERYDELIVEREEQLKEITELLLKKRTMEEEKDKMENLFGELNDTLEKREKELSDTKNKLDNTKTQLADTHNVLRNTQTHLEEQAHIVSVRQKTEEQLSEQARALLEVVDTAVTHVDKLHDSVDRRRNVESSNLQLTQTFSEQSARSLQHTLRSVADCTNSLTHAFNGLHDCSENFNATSTTALRDMKTKMAELTCKLVEAVDEMKSIMHQSQTQLSKTTANQQSHIAQCVASHSGAVSDAMSRFVRAVTTALEAAAGCDVSADVRRFVDQWYSGAVGLVQSLRSAQSSLAAGAGGVERRRGALAASQRDQRRALADRRMHALQQDIAELEAERETLQLHREQLLMEVQTEREDTARRLRRWEDTEREKWEEQRRALEHRLMEHIATETDAMEHRLSKKVKQIEDNHDHQLRRIDKQLQTQQWLARDSNDELERLNTDYKDLSEGGQETLATVTQYTKEFEEGANTITKDMEIMTSNVVQVVENLHSNILGALTKAKDDVQKDAEALVTEDSATGERMVTACGAAFTDIQLKYDSSVDTLMDNIQSNNSHAVNTIASLQSSTAELMECTSLHCSAHSSAIEALHNAVHNYKREIEDGLRKHTELQAKYLSEEYKVYTPSGGTPLRAQYSYPRQLAATSPHQRLLARYRAKRTHDDECIVIESDESRRNSECESTLSDDSTFAAPDSTITTPSAAPITTPRPNPIVKCTSENDIFRQKQDINNGKENCDRTLPYKKPSKLPARAHKRPLLERNGTQ